MKSKIIRKKSIVYLIASVLCITFWLPAKAQESQEDQKDRQLIERSKKQKNLPYAIRDGSPMSSITPEYYNEVAGNYKTDRTVELRNRLIFMAVSQIDIHFRSNERGKRHRNRLFQTVLNILEVGAATAISITNGERAKSVIADGLGFIQGSRDSINKNYRLLDQQILVNKMVEKRAKVLATIYERVAMTEVQYPFERAFIDILDYFEAGRVDSALTELGKDSGSSAATAEKDLQAAKMDADIRLALTETQIVLSRTSAKSVGTVIESEETARGKITVADAVIKTQQKTIDDENAKPEGSRNTELIAKATNVRDLAQTDKDAAQTVQKAAMANFKKIYDAIKGDDDLSPLLKDLPKMYPNLADKINASLERLNSNNGIADDYASIILKFYRRVTDAAVNDPKVVEKATKILESIK